MDRDVDLAAMLSLFRPDALWEETECFRNVNVMGWNHGGKQEGDSSMRMTRGIMAMDGRNSVIIGFRATERLFLPR